MSPLIRDILGSNLINSHRHSNNKNLVIDRLRKITRKLLMTMKMVIKIKRREYVDVITIAIFFEIFNR